MSTGGEETGYSTLAVIVATLATLSSPFITMVVAFILRRHSVDEFGRARPDRKQAQLRTWLWASIGWLLLGTILIIVLNNPS